MSRSLRIVVADDEASMVTYLDETLRLLGHEVVASVHTGRELVERCRTLHPDLVITDIKMSDMDGLDAAAELYRIEPIPVIVVSAYHDRELIDRAERNHVLGFLVKPIKQEDLPPAIAIALRRFSEFQALRKESADLRQALEDRKVIERAKGIIMKGASLNEEQAFQRLEKMAAAKGMKLVEIAAIVVSADEIFQTAAKGQPAGPIGPPSGRKPRNGQ